MADLQIITTTGEEAVLEEVAVNDLRSGLRGDLLLAGDAGYDDARSLWNAAHNKLPALIVQCIGVADVMSAVNLARERKIPVAVRGGGHNVSGSGSCNGGLMLDMSRMKSVRVDPVRRTVRAEPGVIWAELDRETQAFGLATTGGACSQTGIAGVTLGGGFGWLMRKHGLTLDNLISFDIISADGRLRTASAEEHQDLYFGVRGSHSNLGVVTSFEYRLHSVGPTVLSGMVLHPLDKGSEALRFFRDFTIDAPEELSAWAALLTAPDGSPMVAIIVCCIASLETAQRLVRPLREFGPPAADMLAPMPYLAAQSLFDESFPRGRFNYWRSNLLRELSDDAIDALASGFRAVASPYSSVLVERLGGAVGRVPGGQTAFPHRTSPFDLVIMPMWEDAAESEAHRQWADDLWQAMQPFSAGGVYVNYLSNESEQRVRAAYGSSYDRLSSLKAEYDPTNIFCVNQNVPPSTAR